jgi:ubiquinone/menaquinone biosynthesis C-methylase UbiE
MKALWFGSFVTDTIYLAAGSWMARFIGSPFQRALARRRYSSLARHYDADVIPQGGYFAPLEAALEKLPGPPATALDVCTGTGAVIGTVMKRFPTCRGCAVDLSPHMLAHAVRNLGDSGHGARFAAANSARLPFRGAAFDLTTVQNAFPAVRELVRVTKPGGWVLLSYSAGGPVFPWIVRSMTKQLRALGCDPVDTQQVETGRYFLARRGLGARVI